MQISRILTLGKNKYFLAGTESEKIFDTVTSLGQVKSLHDIKQCPFCNEDNLFLRAYKTKTKNFPYTVVQCGNPDCNASLSISENVATKELYYRKNKDKQLDWRKQSTDENEQI